LLSVVADPRVRASQLVLSGRPVLAQLELPDPRHRSDRPNLP